MKFSMVDKQTIRCIMTEEEFADYGLDRQALFQNGDRAKEFYRKIMDRAKEETGFSRDSGDVNVHASFLPEELLSITFSTDKGDALFQEIREELAQEGRAEEPTVHEVTSVRTAICQCRSLSDMIRFCKQIPVVPGAELYRYRSAYYLLAGIDRFSPYQIAVFFNLADEYMEAVCYTPGIVAFLREHGECMVPEHAVDVLCGL